MKYNIAQGMSIIQIMEEVSRRKVNISLIFYRSISRKS